MIDFVSDLYVNIILTTPLVGAYTMFALGIVFIYRASKVLNLAHGAMAMVPAYLSFSMAGVIGVYPALIAAMVIGGVMGMGVERAVVRRLRKASPTAQTVGTVGVFGLLVAFAARQWGTTPIEAPKVFPEQVFHVGNSTLTMGDFLVFATAVGVAVGCVAIFRFTDLGLAMRCSADNRRAAWLMGIDPDRTTAVAWAMAGALAALGGVLLAASTSLHPYILALQVLPAFVAALLGGLESVPGALAGSAVVGLTVGIVPVLGPAGDQVGAPQLALAVVAFVIMSLRGARFSTTQTSTDAGGVL